MAARPDSLDLLPSIDVPTLLIVGEHDLITPPADSQLMLERLPNARLEIIPQAGHMANIENPDEFNTAVVEFVSAISSKTFGVAPRPDGGF